MPTFTIRRPAIYLLAVSLGVVTVWYLLADKLFTIGNMGSMAQAVHDFEAMTGVFKQNDPSTNMKTFDYEQENFGLINRTYDTDEPGDEQSTQWQRFEEYVENLVRPSPNGTTYKVIYVGRHGEGYHNLGEAKYGTKAWDDYWAKLDGDGELYWFDAHLTDTGEQQALHNNAFFARQFSEEKMPASERYYVSPMYRCLQTANLTFSGLDLPSDRPFSPLIKELMREVMGEHTCDKRSTRTVIHEAVPDWKIEDGFSEQDELWQADHRETHDEHDARTQELLDDVFEHDQHTFISFTSHSGAIASLLRVLGHRQMKLPTGGLMPVLIKATKRN